MKRLLYILLAAGLAAGLVGCGESGGGYWPAAGITTGGLTVPAPERLGGNANTANNVFGVSGSSVSGGCASALNTGFAAMPLIDDFLGGLSFPTFGGTTLAAPPSAAIRTGSRSRSKSNATTNKMALTAGSDWTTFTYSTTNSLGGVMTYTTYVKFFDANGNQLTVDTASDTFWAFSGGKTANDVDMIQFYGDWTFYSYSTTTSTANCNVVASYDSSSSSINRKYVISGKMGTATDYCLVAGLAAWIANPTTAALYFRFNSAVTITGSFDGSDQIVSTTSKMTGDATYSKETNLFKYPYPTSTSYFGYGFSLISATGAEIKMVAEGTKVSWYVNGTLVYTYPPTSSTSNVNCNIVAK